jgi:hypothetical protein
MIQYDEILAKIAVSVNGFNDSLPAVQKEIAVDVIDELRRLDLSGKNIKATVANLKIISSIKNKITNLILTEKYKEHVKDFAKTFNEISALQTSYWQQAESTFKPPKLMKGIKEFTVADTVNRLTEAGIGANIGDKISDILRTSISGGGSYRDLTDQLKEMLTDTENSPGALVKYARQITTDALNQYNAQYAQTASSDLGYEWFKYDNTDIETTRPFCDAMTDQPYFHISEIPRLLRAEGLTYVDKDGARVAVPIYPKTGLPHGMIPGTDASNFQIRRGGYNCGHQIRPVNEVMVPTVVKERVEATPEYKTWKGQSPAKKPPVTPEATPPPAVKKAPPVPAAIENNRLNFETLKDKGYHVPEEMMAQLSPSLVLNYNAQKAGAKFQPNKNQVDIFTKGREDNPGYKDKVVIHELAHALHFEKKIITYNTTDPEFQKVFDSVSKRVNAPGVARSIMDGLYKELKTNTNQHREVVGALADIIGSVTRGKFGYGHSVSYYKNKDNLAKMEVFAHAAELHFKKSPLEDVDPNLTEVVKELRAYFAKILKPVDK